MVNVNSVDKKIFVDAMEDGKWGAHENKAAATSEKVCKALLKKNMPAVDTDDSKEKFLNRIGYVVGWTLYVGVEQDYQQRKAEVIKNFLPNILEGFD